MANQVVKNAGGAPAIIVGPLAQRPNAVDDGKNRGTIHVATDAGEAGASVTRMTAAGWEPVALSPAQVATLILAHAQAADPHPGYQKESEKGQPNGYAAKDAGGKLLVADIPDALLGSTRYQGTWNASTNAPDLSAVPKEKGFYWEVSVSGSTPLSGEADWQAGDFAIWNGAAFDKIDNTDKVASFNGRAGAVVPQAGDYSASQVSYPRPDTGAPSDVDAILDELFARPSGTGGSGGSADLPTVAALKALNTTSAADFPANATRRLLGYHAAGDKAGARTYRLDRASTATDNGGTVIAPTTGPGRWLLVWDGSEINVCWFGARPDYTPAAFDTCTDNAPLFAAAKAALDLGRGGTLFAPVGSYGFRTTWNWGAAVRCNVRGEGSMANVETKDALRGTSLVWVGPGGPAGATGTAPNQQAVLGTVPWDAPSAHSMIQVNEAAAAGGDIRHSGPQFRNVNFVSHFPQAGRALYVRCVTGSRLVDCAVRDFADGWVFDSQDSNHGGAVVGGDSAWTNIEGCHEYDCNRGVVVPFAAGLRIWGWKGMHRSVGGQWSIWINGGPQCHVSLSKFDRTNAPDGGGVFLGGHATTVTDSRFEDTNPCVRVGSGTPHPDDGHGNTVSHCSFRILAGVTGVDVTAAGGKVRLTTLLGNIKEGGGALVVDNSPSTYRRDALAPNG